MVDNDKLGRALAYAEKAGCRVVLVGDQRQLAAIGQGGLFSDCFVRARAEQKTALTEIVRQREAWAREAIQQIGRGETAKALKTFDEHGRLHVLPTRDETERRLVECWKQVGLVNPRDNLILASTNADVASLNREAQKRASTRDNSDFGRCGSGRRPSTKGTGCFSPRPTRNSGS